MKVCRDCVDEMTNTSSVDEIYRDTHVSRLEKSGDRCGVCRDTYSDEESEQEIDRLMSFIDG